MALSRYLKVITQREGTGTVMSHLSGPLSEYPRLTPPTLGYSDRGPDKWDITVPVPSLCVMTFKYLERAIYKENSVLKKKPCVDS